MGELIFIVDGELAVCRQIEQVLCSAGFEVYASSGVVALLSEFEAKQPTLVLIPFGFSQAAVAAYEQLRASTFMERTRILIILDQNKNRNEVQGLSPDGWIKPPFTNAEIVDKVRSMLTRPNYPPRLSAKPDLSIDTWAMKILVHGVEVPMTTLEFRLIEYLARHRGQVFTRDLLLDAVWGDMQFITPRSVDACILRIRQKIETDRTKPNLLKTVRGVGYRLDAATEWESPASEACGCVACTTRAVSLDGRFGAKVRREAAADRVTHGMKSARSYDTNPA